MAASKQPGRVPNREEVRMLKSVGVNGWPNDLREQLAARNGAAVGAVDALVALGWLAALSDGRLHLTREGKAALRAGLALYPWA